MSFAEQRTEKGRALLDSAACRHGLRGRSGVDATTAAERLIRLTRYVIYLQDSCGVTEHGGQGSSRRLRHTRLELSGREQAVLGKLLGGKYNRALASAFRVSESTITQYLDETLRAFSGRSRKARRRRKQRRAFALVFLPLAASLFVGALALAEPPATRVRSVLTPANGLPLSAFGFGAPDHLGPDHFGVAGRPYEPAAFWTQLRTLAPLPSGTATATSFWDHLVTRNRRMSYRTLASPYWPLGTEVRVTYRGRTRTGTVRDFGPADWAIAQHAPPAIIDMSEPMMDDLTGKRANAVPVTFKVLKWGKGAVYRASGPGYPLAMGFSPSQ